jgi:hypothetical protein
MSLPQDLQAIISAITEPDTYRHESAVKQAIHDYAVANLAPVQDGYTRIGVTVDYDNGTAVANDGLTSEIESETYASDLAANASRYVLENQYIILCDALRQALGQPATHAKLGFEELPVMMMMLKAGSKDAYEKLRDAMDMVNAALIRYDVRWWDTAVYHPQPELQEASLKIMELAK